MALTLNNFVGFETGGLEEAIATAGTPSLSETSPHSGDYCLRISHQDDRYSIPMATGGAAISADFVVGFLIKLGTGSTAHILAVAYDDDDSQVWSLYLETDGDIQCRDAEASAMGTLTAPLTRNTWQLVEVYWQHSATGTFSIAINGGTPTTYTSQDLTNGNTISADDAYYAFEGSNPGVQTVDYDDIYCLSGASGTGDFLGDAEVFRYQGNTDSASPDFGLASLNVGVWQNCGKTPINADEAAYTGASANGGVYTNDTESGKHYRHGPHGDSNIDGDDEIKGGKWLWSVKRGNGGATAHYGRYGNDSEDAWTAIWPELSTAYAMRHLVLEDTYVPLSTEHFGIGFAVSGARDLYCQEMWGMLLHVPPSGPPPPGQPVQARTSGVPTGSGYRTRPGGWN